MRTLEELQDDFVNLRIKPTAWLGDSPLRFETYARYASTVDSIVEFGVYTGLSTTAFMSGRPKKLRSYDITDANLSVLPELQECASMEGIDFEFQIANSLEVDIEACDLLFIDTVHKRPHTIAELNRHADKVSKYILLHDTSDWPGVFYAVVDFLIEHREWRIAEHCNKGSGLVVLKRTND